ncbi:MAG: prolipoprotein diacylglyceryl transferase [Butyrivibrio sp.]|nr:prolipoprotein diacylglyceryl transferase [Butyrivibrio sp.]
MGPIQFPNLGFEVEVGKSFMLFGKFEIALYGITMALGMIFGALVAYHEAGRTGQYVDDYVDYTIFGILGGVVGARLYYVIFKWDTYKDNLLEIFNLRGGGLAIYGAVIGAALVAVIFCKIKKLNFWEFADTAVLGLITGQIVGRWGNFFNREAFGSYTDSLFAMRIPLADASTGVLNPNTLEEITVTVNGAQYIQVQPTFLYESALNLLLLILLVIFRDKKKFYGETFCRYLIGYGVIRFVIESFRTDQLRIGQIAVSQILSAVLAAVMFAFVIFMRIRLMGKPAQIDPIPSKRKKTAKAAKEKAAEASKEAAKEAADRTEENVGTEENGGSEETSEASDDTSDGGGRE